MKKITLLGYLSMALLLFVTSCNQQDSDIILKSKENNTTNLSKSQIHDISCGETTVVDLIAGQHINVGTVTVSNDETYLYVTYETSGDWYLTETHLYVGAESDIPYTKPGNPKFGHFPYSDPHGTTQSYTYKVDLSTLDDTFAVIAHGVVDKIVNGDTIISGETAFGCGDKEFPGRRWGCYFDYTKQECVEEECIDAYAFKPNSDLTFCFLDDGFTQWGWTNRFTHRFLFRYKILNGVNFQFPLIAEAETCDISSGVQVGYIEAEATFVTTDGVDELFATYKYVITDPNYIISEANLYIGSDKYPDDSDGNDTVATEEYTYSQDGLFTLEFAFADLEWPTLDKETNIFVIPQAKICRVDD